MHVKFVQPVTTEDGAKFIAWRNMNMYRLPQTGTLVLLPMEGRAESVPVAVESVICVVTKFVPMGHTEEGLPMLGESPAMWHVLCCVVNSYYPSEEEAKAELAAAGFEFLPADGTLRVPGMPDLSVGGLRLLGLSATLVR